VERLPGLAGELVRLDPDVIVSHATGVGAIQQATSAIPIVMGTSADPVGFGLIKSLARPGGNTTGVASQLADLASKRLELLKEAVPTLRAVAVLSNLSQPGVRKSLEETESAARRLGVRVRSFEVTANAAELETALAALLRGRPDALVVEADPLTGKYGVLITAFAAKHRLPTMGGHKQFVVDGGLLSYGGSFVEGWKLAARYVDRILKGAKPADLPVEQPTTFELAINLKTARALRLTLPSTLLLRASPGDVIQ